MDRTRNCLETRKRAKTVYLALIALLHAKPNLALEEQRRLISELEDLEGEFRHILKSSLRETHIGQLASGEVSIAMLQESNAYAMVADGEPITIVWPEEGAAASTRVAAICKSTDQPDIAKAFVEFLLDPEVQQELIDTGDEAYFTPSVEGVTAKPDREPNPTLVAADVQFGAENEADIKAWFADYSAQ